MNDVYALLLLSPLILTCVVMVYWATKKYWQAHVNSLGLEEESDQ